MKKFLKLLIWHSPAIGMLICFGILMANHDYTAAAFALVAGYYAYDAGTVRLHLIKLLKEIAAIESIVRLRIGD